jgi:hypothetical protein
MSWRTDDYASRGDPEWLDAPEDRSPEYFDQPYAADHVARKMLEATIARAFHKRVMKEFLRLSQDYPTLPLILTEKRLSVPCTAPDEFPMAIETDRGRYIVHLGAWRDEFAVAKEAVELLEAALRGEIRLRIDIDARAQYCSAERRLINGEWISLPYYEDTDDHVAMIGPIRTIFLRKGGNVY